MQTTKVITPALWTLLSRDEQTTDHRCVCAFCKQQNRVRLGPNRVPVEQETCAHFLGIEERIYESGYVSLVFAR